MPQKKHRLSTNNACPGSLAVENPMTGFSDLQEQIRIVGIVVRPLRWHADMVSREYDFDLRREMESYCVSDVKLLKAGCQKFQEEFASHADFNPMEKCITIASACNRFWRKKLLPENTIAIEPPRFWHGSRTNTSVMARQWVAYENHRLRLQNRQQSDLIYEDPIRTATNGGEVRIRTPAQLPRRRFRCRHQHSARVSRLLVAWLSHLLPQERQSFQTKPRSDFRRDVPSHSFQAPNPTCKRVPAPHNVGVSMA